MINHSRAYRLTARLLVLVAGAALVGPVAPLAMAQVAGDAVPVDGDGNPLQPLDDSTAAVDTAAAPGELQSAEALQALVGPIALYPDDLLAIVLPASTYPLEIVKAARFLEDHENDDSLEPDDAWDESVTALLNYPEVLEMMNDDLDWTWRLGEAVVSQQADVIAAVEAFRDRAYAAGNLKSDEYQTVSKDDGVIEIEPVSEDIIYVPYYEPERVVVYQPRPAYYYYPRPYPVYYYPYPHGYNFHANYFWGVTTAFSIGWATDHLYVFHHSYRGHPYYGHTYYPDWYYRRPSITVYNRWYGDRRSEHTRDHYANGDYWRPHHSGGARPGFHRSRAAYYSDARRERSTGGYGNRPANRPAVAGDRQARSDARPGGDSARPAVRRADNARPAVRNRQAPADSAIRFRQREQRPATAAGRQATERRATVTAPDQRRAQSSTPRQNAGNAITRRAEQRPAARSSSTRREAVTRTPPRATESRRGTETRTPRASAPARAAAPRSQSQSRSSSRPSSRPSMSAPGAGSRPAVSAPRNVSRAATSAPRHAARPTPAPRPAASAPRASAPRSSTPPAASRPDSSSQPARSERRQSAGGHRRVRER